MLYRKCFVAPVRNYYCHRGTKCYSDHEISLGQEAIWKKSYKSCIGRERNPSHLFTVITARFNWSQGKRMVQKNTYCCSILYGSIFGFLDAGLTNITLSCQFLFSTPSQICTNWILVLFSQNIWQLDDNDFVIQDIFISLIEMGRYSLYCCGNKLF